MSSRFAQAVQNVGGMKTYVCPEKQPEYPQRKCHVPDVRASVKSGNTGVLSHGFFEEPSCQHAISCQHRPSCSLRGRSFTESTGSTSTKRSRKSCPARLQRNPLYCSVVQIESNMNCLSSSKQSDLPDVYRCNSNRFVMEEKGLPTSLVPTKAALYFLNNDANTSNQHSMTEGACGVTRVLDDRVFPSQHSLATSEDLRRAMATASKGWNRSWRSNSDLHVTCLNQAKPLCTSQSQGFQNRLRGGKHLKYRQIMSQLKRDSYSMWLEESTRFRDLPTLPVAWAPVFPVQISPSVEGGSLPRSSPSHPNLSPAAIDQMESSEQLWNNVTSPTYPNEDGLPDAEFFDDDEDMVKAMNAGK